MTVEAKKLEETKGSFTLVGKIHGLNTDFSVREGVTKSDKEYKSLSFFVETEPENRVRVEMFGMEREVIFYSSKKKESKRVPFENRDKFNLKGYRLMGVNINPTGKKTDKKVMVEYDAIDYIKDNFNDGDSVYIGGQIDYQEFENQHGELTNKTGFRIQTINKQKEEIDFEDEEFTPKAFFKQDIVVSDLIQEDDKLYVNAKIIKYKGELVDAQFVVDSNRLKRFAKTLKKNLKFGDSIQVKGWIVSKAIKEEVEEEEEVDDWGGENPEGMDNNYITEYINEMQIVNVDQETYEEGKYTEEDLFVEEEENFGKDTDESMDSMDDFEDDEDDDELPFAE